MPSASPRLSNDDPERISTFLWAILVDSDGTGNPGSMKITNLRGLRTSNQPLKKSNQSAAVTLSL
jgi:hypothetical protein